MDNKTAVAQLNKMGGTRSRDLFQITQSLWNYCLEREIIITAEYVPGHLNQKADEASRVFNDSSDWKLDTRILAQIEVILGTAEVDLFANRLNTQKNRYISWKPDPGAVAVDAFTVQWTKMQGYAFPPFCMIARCLAKVRKEQASQILTSIGH